ncbi:MAG TPA: sterol desaturase family protein [Polyangiaceae bacterium]|jgi:sterol desaturase/sphingolipid hydroxylase (fatty acid hydroxylase superfamily)|nr:sterol desaturase family protein [Polyangiaceae bacterium]
MSLLLYFAVPWFVISMIVEARVLSGAHAAGRADVVPYDAKDARASIVMGVGNLAVSAATRLGTVGLYAFLYAHRLFEVGTGAGAWVLLVFAEDFTYYAWHRASHEVRFMWAAHENHHSSERFNLSTALRQSWTTPFTLPLFYFWLPLAGFRPEMILTQISVSLIYQYWVHTELIGKLGPLEWIMNTPSHHRVHHGSNVEYLDRNHAGIFIVWDRLFGTFEPERARVLYGLTKNIETFRPVTIAFHEWAAMLRDVRAARTFGDRLGHLFRPPGWSPDGSTQTAAEMRHRATVTSG